MRRVRGTMRPLGHRYSSHNNHSFMWRCETLGLDLRDDVFRGPFGASPPFVHRNRVKRRFMRQLILYVEMSVENYSKVTVRHSQRKLGRMETEYLWGDLITCSCLQSREWLWSSATTTQWFDGFSLVVSHSSSLWLGGGLYCWRSQILHQVRRPPHLSWWTP